MTQSFPRAIPISIQYVLRANSEISKLNLAKSARLRHAQIVSSIESEEIHHNPFPISGTGNPLEEVKFCVAGNQFVPMIKFPVKLRGRSTPRVPPKKERITQFRDSYDPCLQLAISVEMD